MRNLLLAVSVLWLVANVSVAGDPAGSLELSTTAFSRGGAIPTKFTCSGDNFSPALTCTHPPPGTESLTLIMDDPDAPSGTWVHWVVYNFPPTSLHLPEHVPVGNMISGGGRQGLNDFPQNGYGGPCPPPGKPHRYFFRLYALDTILELHAPVRRADVDALMNGHILARAELRGTFGR